MTEPLLVTVIEAARLLSVSRATVFREIRAKRLIVKKIGRRTLLSMPDIQKYVDSRPRA